jgi:molybdopterin synthase sulfur carrier subunit
MTITVLLSARLKELAGSGSLTLSADNISVVQDVWKTLETSVPQLKGLNRGVLYSVNQEFAEAETPVRDGDEVGVFPPVSGGVVDYVEDENGIVFQIVRETNRLQDPIQQLSEPEISAVVNFCGCGFRRWLIGCCIYCGNDGRWRERIGPGPIMGPCGRDY